MIVYTVSTHFGEKLEGLFYDKEEACQFKLFKIKQFYAETALSDDECMELNLKDGFAKILEIVDAY